MKASIFFTSGVSTTGHETEAQRTGLLLLRNNELVVRKFFIEILYPLGDSL